MKKSKVPKSIGYLLERTTRITKLSFGKAFKDIGVDITPEQWVILESLSRHDGQTQTELASKSFKNAPTISRILDLLCSKGLTERVPVKDDRRSFQVYLTREGKQIIARCQEVVVSLRLQGWSNLTEDDYESFMRIMNQIFDNYSLDQP